MWFKYSKYAYLLLIIFPVCFQNYASAAALSFGSAQLLNRGLNPVLADLNGDGKLDIVAIKNVGGLGPSYQPIWLENKGTTWTEHVIVDWECGGMFIKPADLNGDGHMDLIISSDSLFRYGPGITRVAWLENDGAQPPNFIPHSLINPPSNFRVQNIAVGDINHDGHLDLAVSYIKQIKGMVWWYENNGSNPPVLTSHTLAGEITGPFYNDNVAFADLEGNGYPDLLMGTIGDGTLLFRNQTRSNQNFTRTQISKYIGQICPADLNGDGRLDVAIGYSWCENLDGEPTSFTTSQLISNIALSDYDCGNIALGDLNHDGSTDGILYHPKGLAPYGVDLFSALNDGKLSPSLSMTTRIGAYHIAPAIGDLDGDGNPDIVCNDGTGQGDSLFIYLYHNQLPQQPVRILFPNDVGRVFASGGKMTIKWRTNVSVAGKQVVLELWNGTKKRTCWLTNSSNDQGDGSVTFTLPSVPTGSNYRIRALSTANRALIDFNDEPFTILGSSNTVKAPNWAKYQ